MDGTPPGFHHPPPPPPPAPAERQSSQPPTKRQKVAIACDVCRAKKVKVSISSKPGCAQSNSSTVRWFAPHLFTLRPALGSWRPVRIHFGVHHLELKLRELQAEKGQSPITLPHQQSDLGTSPAISHARAFEGSWSSPGPQQSEFSAKHSPLRTYSSHHLTNGNRGHEGRSHQQRPPPQQHQITPTPKPSGHKPLLFKKPRARNDHSLLLGAGDDHAHFLASGTAASFVHRIKPALDAKVKTAAAGQETPVLSGSPLPQLPTLQPKVQDAPRIEYVLPSRKMADTLLEVYWKAVHPFYPFLDRRQFQSMYDGIWAGEPSESDESLMMCTLNVVFALASQLSDTLPPKERESSARRYFERAQDLLSLDLWDVGSVQLVQCLLLMSRYLQSTRSSHQAWIVTGLTIRIAEGLGLHLPETSIGIDNVYQRELVRRVWHGCVLMDRILSMQFDRPTMLGKLASQSVPLPMAVDDAHMDKGQPNDQPAVIAFYIEVVELFESIARVTQNSASMNRGAEYFSSRDHYQVLFGDSQVTPLMEILKLDQSLMLWASSLPAHLRVDASDGPARHDNPIFIRQANVLRSIYLHTRILLFRPVLSRFCLAPLGSSQIPSSSSPSEPRDIQEVESLPDHFARSCSTLCLCAAHDAIQLIYSNLDQINISGPVPHWWYCVLFTYSAATVLQAARLRSIPSGNPGYDITTSWTHALEIIRTFEPLSPHAERCLVTLQIIAEKVTETITGAAGTVRSSTFSHHTMEAMSAPLPGTAGDATDPNLSNSSVDFDVNDMSWLTSAPVNL